MNDIVEIANQASKEWLKEFPAPEEAAHQVPKRFLEIFAKLVAEREREACALIADRMDACQDGEIGKAIRARGES
jgi:hypothetical protein